MKRICIFALVTLFGLAAPLFMAETASAQQAPDSQNCNALSCCNPQDWDNQNNLCIPPAIVFGVAAAGLVAGTIIALDQHHTYYAAQNPHLVRRGLVTLISP